MNRYRKYASKMIHDRYLSARISMFDVFPYGELLLKFSRECNNITEITLSPINNKLSFTWCMLYGLHQSRDNYESIYGKESHKKFTSFSIDRFHSELLYLKDLSNYSDIECETFRLKKDTKIENTDMLFIYVDTRSSNDNRDSKIHYDILKQINNNKDLVKKYIIIYDLNFNDNFGYTIKNDDVQSASIEFLQNNHDWSLLKGNNTEFRFTVMKRLENDLDLDNSKLAF